MNPLRRHFRKDGPNYPLSGLDTAGRDAERRESLATGMLSTIRFPQIYDNPTFGNEQGAGFDRGISPAPCSPQPLH